MMRLARTLLVLAAPTLAHSQQYTVSIYAGGVPPLTPAPGINLSIGYPAGMALDAADNAYFVALNCVFKLDQHGIVTRIAGNRLSGYWGDGGSATSAQLQMQFNPGITVDDAGNVYVADDANYRIRKISPDGIITTVAGNGTYGFSGDGGPATSAQFSYVHGMAIDTAGNLLIADADNNRIRLISQDGTITSVAGDGSCGFSGDGGPAVSAQLCSPTGMARDNAGNVLFADTRNNRIRRISADGTITTAAGSGLWQPASVAVDGAGNLLIADTVSDGWDGWQVVRKLSPSGTMTTVAGCDHPETHCPASVFDGSSAIRTLTNAPSLGVDSAGNLLIADGSIRKVFPDGSIVKVVGNGEYEFSGDGGPAKSAQLTAGSLAVDGASNLFLVDGYNARIRKVSPDGIITTVAGNGTWGTGGDGGLAANASLSPTGMAVDAAGNLFISENLAGIRKVSPDDIITPVAAVRGEALAVDRVGNLFISDYTSIRKVSPDGSITEVVSRANAVSLAVDNAGNLFFAERFRVRRLSPDGSLITVAGNETQGFSGDGGPAIDAQLDYAEGVAVDDAGTLFIADRDNNRIRKVSPDGIITTIAGNGTRGYSGDGGIAIDTSITASGSIAVDGAGNVYFADTTNSAIRVLHPTNRPIGGH